MLAWPGSGTAERTQQDLVEDGGGGCSRAVMV